MHAPFGPADIEAKARKLLGPDETCLTSLVRSLRDAAAVEVAAIAGV